MYVPELGEILTGLHRILERDVIPSIDDRYGRNQAMLVSMQIRDLMARWEALPAAMERENAEMREALTACERKLAESASASPSIPATRDAIRAQLGRTYAESVPTRSVAGLAAEHSDLLATLAEAARSLIAAERDNADPAVTDGHAALRAVIRQHAESRNPGIDSSSVRHRN
jgi:hypothetical protein